MTAWSSATAATTWWASRRRTGEPAWTRYIWFSWVESSAAVRDGVVYVGSSDAAAVYAFDARTGERRWKTDVYGWAWGQPAVTDARVYAGTASQKDYLAGHKGLVVAMDRASGRPAWHYAAEPAATGSYGFRARRPWVAGWCSPPASTAGSMRSPSSRPLSSRVARPA